MPSRRNNLIPIQVGPSFHAGLWLDKFLPDCEVGGVGNTPHLKAVQDVIRVPEGYTSWIKERSRLFDNTPDIKRVTATVNGRMVVGLGQKGVLEVGIRLDRTWGVPVIPGSSLKGIAALAARNTGRSEWKKDGESYLALFGDTDEKGAVSFHDAYWKPGNGEKLPLYLDVMTVHHPKYYSSTDETPPSDMDNPTPISFLSVNGSYEVFLEGPAEWVDAAFGLLKYGLEKHGIGAKTAGGYGRMKLDYKTAEETKKEAAEEVKNELSDALRIVTGLNGGSAGNQVPKELDKLTTEDNRKQFADAVIQHFGPKFFKKKKDKEWVKRLFEAAKEPLSE